MTSNEFYTEIENLIGAEPGSVNADVAVADVENWDSMGRLSFIAFVEERFGVIVDTKKVAQVQKFGDLADLVGEHLKA